MERIFQAILWGFQKTKLITSLSLEVLSHADYQKEVILWNWPASLAHFFPFEGSHMANYPVQDVEGIGPVRGEALRNAGINDTDKFWPPPRPPSSARNWQPKLASPTPTS